VKASHLAGLLVLGVAGVASADPGAFNRDALDLSVLDRAVAPTGRALEVAVGAGYTQGAGGAGQVGSLEDITGAGGNVELQVGVRVTPNWTLGGYGTMARFSGGDSLNDGHAWGATAGVQARWNARESRSLDPWISLGAGWRGLWVRPSGQAEASTHGGELRLQLGVDYRISPTLAISPVVGASASMFVAEDGPMTDGLRQIDDKQLNVYGFTGVLGRFDLGG
jgi:hypothetical protein